GGNVGSQRPHLFPLRLQLAGEVGDILGRNRVARPRRPKTQHFTDLWRLRAPMPLLRAQAMLTAMRAGIRTHESPSSRLISIIAGSNRSILRIMRSRCDRRLIRLSIRYGSPPMRMPLTVSGPVSYRPPDRAGASS